MSATNATSRVSGDEATDPPSAVGLSVRDEPTDRRITDVVAVRLRRLREKAANAQRKPEPVAAPRGPETAAPVEFAPPPADDVRPSPVAVLNGARHLDDDHGVVGGPSGVGELDAMLRQFAEDRQVHIGFPGAMDFDYGELMPFFGYLLNNVGDPEISSMYRSHTKHLEREVVAFFADLFRAPADDRWGYVTTGGTESNLYALYLARSRFPDAPVYCSEATHYSIHKAADLLALRLVTIRSTDRGEMDYDELGRSLAANRDVPAIVVANIGTTMTEAVDDVGRIRSVLHEQRIRRHHVHSDAALSGVPLALLDSRPRFDLADGADSITISGHKFVGAPFPCGVVVTRRSLKESLGRPISYTGSPDTTISGSRSGHAPLMLWYAINRFGLGGFRRRADQARELAAYTTRRLAEVGWEAWRNPHALTVVLKTPSAQLARRWMLATGDDGWSHIICMPGVTSDHIDRFVAELAAAEGLPPPATSGPWRTPPSSVVPRQRTRGRRGAA